MAWEAMIEHYELAGRLIEGARLIAICAPPGFGKTFAVQSAIELSSNRPGFTTKVWRATMELAGQDSLARLIETADQYHLIIAYGVDRLEIRELTIALDANRPGPNGPRIILT